MASGYILNKSDIAKTLYDMNKDYEGNKTWVSALNNVNMAEQRAMEDLQYDYGKAIGEAYASSLSNNTAIADSSLGQGYKQRLIEQNMMDVHDAFERYRSNYLTNKEQLASTYNDTRNEIYSNLNDLAANNQRFEEATYAYLQELAKRQPTLYEDERWSRYFVEDENDGWRLRTKEDLFAVGTPNSGAYLVETSPGEYELTEAGKDYYRQLYGNTDYYTFQQFLSDNSKYDDLVDWANSASGDYGYTNRDVYLRDVLGIDLDNQKYTHKYTGQGAFNDTEGDKMLFKDAKYKYDEIMSNDLYTTEQKNELTDTYLKLYAKDIVGDYAGTYEKTLDINSDDFNVRSFGNYLGVSKTGGKQNTYIDTLLKDLRDGKVKEGQIIVANLGEKQQQGSGTYVYLGNGRLAKVSGLTKHADANKVYTPTGYKAGLGSLGGQFGKDTEFYKIFKN